MAVVISTTVYHFNSAGNAFVKTEVLGIPTPAMVVPASSPDPKVYCYSKLITQPYGPNPKEYYTAESVASLISKQNS